MYIIAFGNNLSIFNEREHPNPRLTIGVYPQLRKMPISLLNWTILMLHDFHLDLNGKRRQEKNGGGPQILDWMYAGEGGGSFKCVLCATGGVGGSKIRKKCVCN